MRRLLMFAAIALAAASPVAAGSPGLVLGGGLWSGPTSDPPIEPALITLVAARSPLMIPCPATGCVGGTFTMDRVFSSASVRATVTCVDVATEGTISEAYIGLLEEVGDMLMPHALYAQDRTALGEPDLLAFADNVEFDCHDELIRLQLREHRAPLVGDLEFACFGCPRKDE